MTGVIATIPRNQFLGALGAPLAGFKLYTYLAGSTTPVGTYKDQALTDKNENPIKLDATGSCSIWLDPSMTYKFVLKSPLGVTQPGWPVDNISGAATPLSLQPTLAAYVTLATLAGVGATGLIGATPIGAGAATIPLQEKLGEIRTNLDFVPLKERAAILAGTSTYDATVAVQKAIDTAGAVSRLLWLGTVNTKALTSAAAVDWEFAAGAKVKQIPAVYGFDTWHIKLTGAGVRIANADFDGNQDAMLGGQGSNGLLINGASPTLLQVKCHDYAGRGYDCNSVNTGMRRALHVGCSFDDNAGLGMMTTAACYLTFLGCTFDRNGYGFQKARANYADTSHGFIAFGVAIRLRSHHIEFSQCHARDNGRDGFNVNQGSYAVKFAQCLAAGNDDGGFTIASDNTNSGLPGESEACYDITYTDCEAYNNYSSGLAAYQTCHNVRVVGGRFYNNHRLAGNQGGASSYYNGIFFAGGSSGISIDASAYDDRQYRVITAVAGGAITATDWVPGTMNFYPKVAVYAGADQSFRGYAKITAEAAGSVTITPTASNGVNLASIIAGDYITQAVQHGGVFTDNNCQGSVAAEGAGLRPGPAGGPGRLVFSGGYSPGQNILLPKERQSATELLANPTFDAGITGWTFNIPGGGAADPFTGTPKRSAGALRLIAGTSAAQGDATLIASAAEAAAGCFVEFGGWVNASARNDAFLTLFWFIGGSTFYTEMHHPGGGWRYLKIGALLPSEITGLTTRVNTAAGKTVYFDSMSFRAVELHADSRDFAFPSRSLPL